MLTNLFSIMFRPNVTLNRLLEQRKFGRSWGTTWFLIGLNVLVMFIFAIFLFRFIESHRAPEMYPPYELSTRVVLWGIFAVLLIGGTVQAILYFGLGRILFSWIVRLGLHISAGRNYPQDPYERADKGRLLAMVHPYTTWISHWPMLLLTLCSSLLFLMPGLMSLLEDAEFGTKVDRQAELQVTIVFLILILILIWNLVQFGMWIYMIIVRTIAIQKIYGIGAGQAFWGPFLIYFLLYCVGIVLYLVLVFVVEWLGGGPIDTGGVPDVNSHLSI
ncbi:hypothetical protein [Tumebacillus permanentifrigoris]|uniref:Uncharacterized protein n=1 Tax=Tumebacillus permanentifrigoris TaxID=378543 RepID=A0A316D6Z2_9BACL|nr:hypothetical protein [Tumebacillus permanentifrigoris]PWK11226.1 hypothetical protein C7459_11119 [Tumebacillus permanentifrigoris]